MKQVWLAAAISMGVMSCAEEPAQLPEHSEEPAEQNAEIGSLSLRLTGVDSQGRQYRLRDAEFVVSSQYYFGRPEYVMYPYYGDAGPSGYATRVSTETDPNSDSINLTLVPGNYYVSIEGAWYIERMTANGPERVERAVLLSEPLQYAYVYQNGRYNLVYRFGVDGDLIDFRHGELQIDAEFELPGDNDYQDAGPSYPYPRDSGVVVPAQDGGMAQFPF